MSEYSFPIGDMGALRDVRSPAESLDLHDEVEPHVETSGSELHSPVELNCDIDFPRGIGFVDVFPTPATSPCLNPSPKVGAHHKENKKPVKKPTPKRKRENRYKNAPPDVLSRRREQNRASQRAYRERKDQRIKDLEAMLEEQKQKNEQLSRAYDELQQEYTRLVKSSTTAPTHRSHSQFHLALPYDMMVAMNGTGVNGIGVYGFQSKMEGFPM